MGSLGYAFLLKICVVVESNTNRKTKPPNGVLGYRIKVTLLPILFCISLLFFWNWVCNVQ